MCCHFVVDPKVGADYREAEGSFLIQQACAGGQSSPHFIAVGYVTRLILWHRRLRDIWQ